MGDHSAQTFKPLWDEVVSLTFHVKSEAKTGKGS
jgi:hypothetical protein